MSLALSARVSPQTVHFQVLDTSPLLGPGRGPPSCNTSTSVGKKRNRFSGVLRKETVSPDDPGAQDSKPLLAVVLAAEWKRGPQLTGCWMGCQGAPAGGVAPQVLGCPAGLWGTPTPVHLWRPGGCIESGSPPPCRPHHPFWSCQDGIEATGWAGSAPALSQELDCGGEQDRGDAHPPTQA